MTQEEAEEAVKGNAQVMFLPMGIATAASAAFVGRSLHKRMQRKKSEVEAIAPSAEEGNEDVQISNQASTEDGHASAVVVGKPEPAEIPIPTDLTRSRSRSEPEENPIPTDLTRSRSRLEAMDEKLKSSPSKAMLVGWCSVVIPLITMIFLFRAAFSAERPWHDTLLTFFFVVAPVLLVVAAVVRFSIFVGKHGPQEAMRIMMFTSENPIGPLVFVKHALSNTMILAPFLFAAGLAWSLNRMSNPGSRYYDCNPSW